MRRNLTVPVTVRLMTDLDLPGLTWAGAHHVEQVAGAMHTAASGSKDFLIAVLPNGQRAAKGEIAYTEGTASIGSVAVRAEFQSLGIGTLLIEAAEALIRERGLTEAQLDAEEGNPRARSLYERLGYSAYGRHPDSWDQEAPDGSIYRYETVCILMHKPLG